jgi:hypothetical protein
MSAKAYGKHLGQRKAEIGYSMTHPQNDNTGTGAAAQEKGFMADFTTTNWFPVLTLLLGFGVKSLSDWVDHRRMVERDHAARGAARKEKNLERRIDFQHQTLLDLQEACMQLACSTSAMHHQDIMAFRNTGVWQK